MEDPVTVDPKHYTVELENEKVRVVRIKYGPHEKSVMRQGWGGHHAAGRRTLARKLERSTL